MRPETKNIGKEPEMPHYRTTLTFKTECLRKKGYDQEFQISKEGLKSLKTGEVFQAEDIKVIEHQRFEGISDPDDMAILYVIETKNGLKGTVVDAFGVYANKELSDFMKKVKFETVENIDEIAKC